MNIVKKVFSKLDHLYMSRYHPELPRYTLSYNEDYIATLHVPVFENDEVITDIFTTTNQILFKDENKISSSKWRNYIYIKQLASIISNNTTNNIQIIELGVERGVRLLSGLIYLDKIFPENIKNISEIFACDTFNGWNDNKVTEVESLINPIEIRNYPYKFTKNYVQKIFKECLSEELYSKITFVDGVLPNSIKKGESCGLAVSFRGIPAVRMTSLSIRREIYMYFILTHLMGPLLPKSKEETATFCGVPRRL